MKQALYYIMILTAILATSSCSKDDIEYPTPIRSVDIVTCTDTQSGMKFELQRAQESEIIPLITSQSINTSIPPGRRVIIEYEAAATDTALRPIPVKLLQIGLIPFDTIRSESLNKILSLPAPQMQIISIWRTGCYINMQTDMEFDGNTRSYSITADRQTIGTDIVECYLYNTGEEVSPNHISRRSYASFFIGEIWQNPDLKQIRLYTNGARDKNSYIDIAKNPQ